ncbi:MAG: manganese-binding transcriptional regulator MntR [Pseudomonadota bacterium]|nr:manganese-binding transcriptional regulator MntR [Pseudomonadota bacterium]
MNDSENSREQLKAPPEGTGAISAHMTPDRQASHFKRARQARETEIIEDYVELVADLIDEQGEARAVDIARRLGVTGATVNKMVSRLKQMGLVNAEPYRSIFLTKEGRHMAEASRARHHIVVALLRAVGVDEATAWADAEGMEHRCSPETLAAFSKFVKLNKLYKGRGTIVG